MDNKIFRQVLEATGSNLVNRIVRILGSNNKVASGRLINSVEYIIGEKEGQLFLELLMEDYWIYVDRGRKPGKFAPISALKSWTRYKGLPESAAWAINWKIKREGIKALPFLEQAISQIEEEFSKSLEEKWGSEIGKELGERLQRALRK